MVDQQLQDFALELLESLYERFPLSFKPRLIWRNYRSSAGMAYFTTHAIGLSAKILTTRETLHATLCHEYAHLLAFARHGRKAVGHGEAWKEAMRELGCQPTVRHRYHVPPPTFTRRLTYECRRCGLHFARSRALSQGRKYLHRGCGGVIRLLRVEIVTSQTGTT